MRPSDEVEAAYFGLLRAREDLDALRRFEEYLSEEARRLRRFVAEGRAHQDTIAAPLRLRLEHTVRPLQEAITSRLESCLDELSRMPDRLAAAEAFVADCERRHDALRTG